MKKLSHEGIRPPLSADRGRRPVTRQDRDVVAERIELLLEPAKQEIAVAPRQIPAADTACEKDVAADEQLFLRRIKTEAAGAMAGHFQDLQLKPEKIAGRRCLN